MTDLGTLDGQDGGSQGIAINDLGEVIGFSTTASGSGGYFTDQNGVMTPFNVGDPFAINDSGEIAGAGSFLVENTDDVFGQAFTYKNGKTTVLGLFPGGVESGATAINRSGSDSPRAAGSREDRSPGHRPVVGSAIRDRSWDAATA